MAGESLTLPIRACANGFPKINSLANTGKCGWGLKAAGNRAAEYKDILPSGLVEGALGCAELGFSRPVSREVMAENWHGQIWKSGLRQKLCFCKKVLIQR